MTNKEKYREFYAAHPDMCIFSAPWWLDAVASDTWDVILIEKSGTIVASFPYVYAKGTLGIKKITMPPLTQKLGPYIVYDKNLSYTTKIGYEHKIYQQIIDALPEYDEFTINFDQQYKNWLPFYWNGFSQSTHYSYQIYDIKNYDKVFLSFDKKKRYEIRKARESLEVFYDFPACDFYQYFQRTILDRGDAVGFSKQMFFDIYKAIYTNNAGRVFYCKDANNKIHGIELVVWDKKSAYDLIGIRGNEYKSTGATEFLTETMIKYVSPFVDIFDFEGSMIKGVEQSYRYYGTQQTEYYSISKVNNKFLKLYRALRS